MADARIDITTRKGGSVAVTAQCCSWHESEPSYTEGSDPSDGALREALADAIWHHVEGGCYPNRCPLTTLDSVMELLNA